MAEELAALTLVLKNQIDVTISYSAPGSYYGDLHSDHLKEQAYHEFTHTAHYAALGNGWYTQFVNSEINQIINTIGSSKSPYGDKTSSGAPIIAVGESWAYYMGQYLANKRYTTSSSETHVGEQGIGYTNTSIAGLSSHLASLENFNPNYTIDPFYWIPKGIYYDLMDSRNDKYATSVIVNLDDQSSAYTNQQFFTAFNSGITTIQQYKSNLQQRNVTNPSNAQISNLFFQYGY